MEAIDLIGWEWLKQLPQKPICRPIEYVLVRNEYLIEWYALLRQLMCCWKSLFLLFSPRSSRLLAYGQQEVCFLLEPIITSDNLLRFRQSSVPRNVRHYNPILCFFNEEVSLRTREHRSCSHAIKRPCFSRIYIQNRRLPVRLYFLSPLLFYYNRSEIRYELTAN